jgi:hypothetical protein
MGSCSSSQTKQALSITAEVLKTIGDLFSKAQSDHDQNSLDLAKKMLADLADPAKMAKYSKAERAQLHDLLVNLIQKL